MPKPKTGRAQNYFLSWEIHLNNVCEILVEKLIPVLEEEDADPHIRRFNLHQLYKPESSKKISDEIERSLDKMHRENAETAAKYEEGNSFVYSEPKKTVDSELTAAVTRIGRHHVKEAERLIPLPEIPKRQIYTSSKPIQDLKEELQADLDGAADKKRQLGSLFAGDSSVNDSPSKRRKATFNSFRDTSVKSFEDLMDANTKYFATPVNRTPKTSLCRIETNISARHIEKVLYQPYSAAHQKQCCLALTKTCRSMQPELRHPLSPNTACMAYFSPIEWEAYSAHEQVSCLESPADQYFPDPLCVFCYRYYLTKMVRADSVGGGSSISVELPTYYHMTGVQGEYKPEACLQPNGGNLSGINGNIVMYDAATFVPIVGLVKEDDAWEMEEILTIDEFRRVHAKGLVEDRKLAYGWMERGVFVKPNNNTLPETSQINPYSSSYTRVKGGPITARLILRGYFKQRAGMKYPALFMELREAVERFDILWKLDHPLTLTSKLEYYNQRNQFLDAQAKNPWEKFHLWQNVCLHPPEAPPDKATCKIYFAFLFIINGLLELNVEGKSYPEQISKKLKHYIDAFTPLQEYYKSCEGDYSDDRLKTVQSYNADLRGRCSSYFAFYPRTKKTYFRVHDYRYLKFEQVNIKVDTPDVELSRLYDLDLKPVHSRELLREARDFESLLLPIHRASAGSYQSATMLFNKLVNDLREPKRLFSDRIGGPIQWPNNIISAYNPIRDKDMNNPSQTELRRREDIRQCAEEMTEKMRKIFLEINKVLVSENEQYKFLRGEVKHILQSFNACLEYVKGYISKANGIKLLLDYHKVGSFDYLLPNGFTADVDGINFLPWNEHLILLTALLRVHIAERLIILETHENKRARMLLTLLRNSHIPLIAVICEMGPYCPVKRNDRWLTHTSVMPPGGLVDVNGGSHYKPSLSYLSTYLPISEGAFHEGRLPNLASALMHSNYFTDSGYDSSEPFILYELFKHKANLSTCPGKAFINVFSSDPLKITTANTTISKFSKRRSAGDVVATSISKIDKELPKRFLLVQMMRCSFLGLYEHALVKPSFRVSTQLSSLFDNIDVPSIKAIFNHLLSSIEVVGKKRHKFEKILNELVLEYVHLLQKGNVALYDVMLATYDIDLTRKSLISMDLLRQLLTDNESLSLPEICELRQKTAVKPAKKVVNNFATSVMARFNTAILTSDIPRYGSKFKRRACLPPHLQVTPQERQETQNFVDHLNPNGKLYAEELEYIQFTPGTIKNLAIMDSAISGPTPDYLKAIGIFEAMEIRQSSSVAFFFSHLQNYMNYGELVVRNKDFVESQERRLKNLAGIPKDFQGEYVLPRSTYTTLVSPCCGTWNGFPSTSQYAKKEYSFGTQQCYLMSQGNQSVTKDPISGVIYCKSTKKASAKKKQGNARDLRRKEEAPPGVIAGDIAQSFFTVTSDYLDKKRLTGDEPTRLNQMRALEGRKASCTHTPVLEINLRGRILTANKKMKHPGKKQKEKQFLKNEAQKSNDRTSLYPPFKAHQLRISQPPYAIEPCCGRIGSICPSNWGVNGYYCGGCLPRSNIELGIVGEIRCASCGDVVPNRPAFNRCAILDCPSNQASTLEGIGDLTEAAKTQSKNECKHGASPVLVVDDIAKRPTYAYFCDHCYKKFEIYEPGLICISSVKKGDVSIAEALTEGARVKKTAGKRKR